MHHNTISGSEQERLILTKIRMLPPDKVTEVADFVDFISQKDQERHLIQAAGKMAQDAFKEVWDNSEDDVYDRL
ncbi:MAG: toxin-antitoxin system, antitoxin component, Xre family protein [Pseudomonadota bacterium]